MKREMPGQTRHDNLRKNECRFLLKKRHFFKNSLEKVYSNAQKWVEKVHSGVLGGGAT